MQRTTDLLSICRMSLIKCQGENKGAVKEVIKKPHKHLK